MNEKIETLFDYIKSLCESDLDRIINFVLGIVSVNQQSADRPDCPYCGGNRIIKYGHRNGKQRFLCKDCRQTFMHTTNTLMANSHYVQSVWADFIRDTLYVESLDNSSGKLGFSHQTAFNMRHKVLMALQNLLGQKPVLLSGIAEFDETFVLDCYKGAPVPECAGRKARKHGAKAAKRGISEYIAICTGIQRDGGIVAETVNRTKPSARELNEVFCGHIAEDTLILTDRLRSYNILEALANCTVVDVNQESCRGIFNLNTVNSLHSYIKETYNHYRGVATKYINRYNALFSIAFRAADNLKDTLFAALCNVGQKNYWHSYDCLFYQAIMDAVYEHKKEIVPDVLFTHCGGKTRIKDIVSALKAVDVPVVAICDFDLLNASQNFKPIIASFGLDWKTTLSADMKIIYDSMNAKSSCENDAWTQIKKIGKVGFSGDAPAAYERVEAVCKSVGLFVVPVGEMECFDKTVNKEKKDWVYNVLENYNLAEEPKLEDAREFVQSVVDYKSSKKVDPKSLICWF